MRLSSTDTCKKLQINASQLRILVLSGQIKKLPRPASRRFNYEIPENIIAFYQKRNEAKHANASTK